MKRSRRRRRDYGLVRYYPISYGRINDVRTRKGRKSRRERSSAFFGAFFAAMVLSLIVAIAAILYMGMIRPKFGDGAIEISLGDGVVELTWPAMRETDRCRVYCYEAAQNRYVWYGEYGQEKIVLPDPGTQEELTYKLQVVRETSFLGFSHVLQGEKKKLSLDKSVVARPVLTESVNVGQRIFSVRWPVRAANEYEVFLTDQNEDWQLYETTVAGGVDLDFMRDMQVPQRDQPIRLAVRAKREGDGYVMYSALSDPAYIDRSKLMEGNLGITWARTDVCQYILRWEAGKGRYYEIQQWSQKTGEWETKETRDRNSGLSYETGRLPSGTEVRFRIVTYNNETERLSGAYVDDPTEVSFRTEYSPLYCTIWPLVDLTLQESAQGGAAMGQVPAGTPLCVLGESDGQFRVRYRDQYGYLDSRYCMINLPDYIGNLCAYDITNSYASLFRVHGYDIPGITGTVVKGYEGICLDEKDFLVPYLYPCTKKLIQAAEAVREDGYYLRIYDAFRPNEATRYLYDTMERLMDLPLPERSETDWADDGTRVWNGELYGGLKPEALSRLEAMSADQLQVMGLSQSSVAALGGLSPQALLQIKNLSEGALAVFASLPGEQLTAAQADPNTAAQLGLAQLLGTLSFEEISVLRGLPGGELTAFWRYLTQNMQSYDKEMTNGSYHLGSFLAAETSAHNRGIAVDLTLERLDGKGAVQMQTSMHDLSWNSALTQNNANADLLAQYMKNAGFHDLISEWWHFQDDETRNEIGLNSYLTLGVEVTGWKKDDQGWKYRQADGSYYQNCTVEIDGANYTFDENGYGREE